ncbi:hypothetical protein [Rhodopila sp.]|uniref:hypothetical protein n=1 Tax=Rhodopila sp. TaxID=2480087 RepID=UPI003D0FA741
MLIVAAATTCHALNPANLDIVGLRLGMAEPQVDALLLRQGIPISRINRSVERCRSSQACDVMITASTKDGTLTISLNKINIEADPTVGRIAYVLRGHAAGEAKIIEASVLERFGQPDQAVPMTWCQNPSANQICSAGQPSLRFVPESLTLILKSGAAEGAAEQSAPAPDS